MGFRRYFPAFVTILLLLISASGVGGQDDNSQGVRVPGSSGVDDSLLAEARELSAQGKLQDAAGAYTKWLAENADHDDFGLILIEAADSQLSIERALELLRVYTPRVQDPQQQELCRASQIDLLEMLGRTEQALGLLRSFPPAPWWLYRQAQMLYQGGLAEEAEKSLQQALKALLGDENSEIDKNNERNEDLEARIRLLQARILVIQDRGEEAENLLQLLAAKFTDTPSGPGILLAYYEYLLAQGRDEAAEKQLEKLAREFPDSPELALARGAEGETRIGYAPIPSRLLPRDFALPPGKTDPDQSGEQQPKEAPQPPPEALQPASPTALQSPNPTALVQTGSFRDRENAEYMVRDLEASGFEAGIVNKTIGGTLYFRVVIGPLMTVDQAQAVLMRLKDAGFEGVLLFSE